MFNNQLNTTHTRTHMHLRRNLKNFQVFVKIYLGLSFSYGFGNALIISDVLLYLYQYQLTANIVMSAPWC